MYFYAGEQIFLFLCNVTEQSYATCQLQPYSNKYEIWLKACTFSAINLQYTVCWSRLPELLVFSWPHVLFCTTIWQGKL